MYILGINAYHGDSSACLVRDGVLVAASEEERFRRIKHWAGFPSEAIKSCLRETRIDINDVDHIAVNSNPLSGVVKKIKFVLGQRPDIDLVFDRIKNARNRTSIEKEIKKIFPDYEGEGKIHRVEHHLAHLASCYLVSGFDEAVALSVDGFGDFASAAWGKGENGSISVDGKVYYPHSLGIFYQALTQYLGFPNYGDEYKVMGLAPYGKPTYMEQMTDIVLLKNDGSFELNLKYFKHHKEKIKYEWDNDSPVVGDLYTNELDSLLGCARSKNSEVLDVHKNLAKSVQTTYENAFFHMLNALYEKYKADAVALAGGCAMNSVANGKIYKRTAFKKCYIQSAAGDAGGAIGAAMHVWSTQNRGGEKWKMDHAYWGPEYDNDHIHDLLEKEMQDLQQNKCTVKKYNDYDELCEKTAGAIVDGKVIGWFQGRMEWGPRALGNRSILGDPRRADMKDILNLKIKRRESFRPFAPSILREYVSEWFETDDDVPFMMKVFVIKDDMRPLIPAVTHVDGSGRLQTVSKSTNERYYKLISKFNELTGVPIVLNTSFNENEPVVCKPKEALDCFLRTNMDVLVLGDYMITRE